MAGRDGSDGGGDVLLHRFDADLVSFVEGPLFDTSGPEEAGLGEDLEVFARGGLADAELVGDEDAADAVLDEVTVDLWGEVGFGVFEPFEDLEAAFVGQGAHGASN